MDLRRGRIALTLAVFAGSAAGGAAQPAAAPAPTAIGDSARDLVFTPVPRCRVLDTRVAGGRLSAGIPRAFDVAGPLAGQGGAADCQVPFGPATVVMLNLTPVQAAGPGTLAAWPFGAPMPATVVFGFNPRSARASAGANELTLAICDPAASSCTFDLNVQANGNDTHLVVDVAGYFSSVSGLTVPWSAVTGKPAGFEQLALTGCAPNQVIKWIGSGWACGTDVDTNAGGTVTSVTAGSGLSGGTITGAGTVAVASGGITSGMIASGAVGLNQINTAQVQARLSGTCAAGRYLRGINADGTPLCEPIVLSNVVSTVDDPSVNNVGQYASIAIGADGLPVIAYLDDTADALKVTHCGNIACSSGNTITTVDNPANLVGAAASIAIGADGLPVIAYRDLTASALKVAHCGNVSCSAGNTLTTVDDPATGGVASHMSLAIGTDGLPIVSYQAGGALKVAHCGDAGCTAGNVLTVVEDLTNPVGEYNSIAIGADGLPVISYVELNANDLRVLHCGNVTCTAGNTALTVDSLNIVGTQSSIAIGADGRPVIAYQDNSLWSIKVLRCGNAACSSGNTATTLDDIAGFVTDPAVAIGADGLPVVAYRESTTAGTGALKVAHCGNAGCTAGNVKTVADAGPEVGSNAAIAIGVDDLPVIAYYDVTNAALKVFKCTTRTCR
jgi:hypothetical protein